MLDRIDRRHFNITDTALGRMVWYWEFTKWVKIGHYTHDGQYVSNLPNLAKEIRG